MVKGGNYWTVPLSLESLCHHSGLHVFCLQEHFIVDTQAM